MRDLPRGVDQYLEQRESQIAEANQKESVTKTRSTAAQERQFKKDLARLERQIEKATERASQLRKDQQDFAYDPVKLSEIENDIAQANELLAKYEEEWLITTEALGG